MIPERDVRSRPCVNCAMHLATGRQALRNEEEDDAQKSNEGYVLCEREIYAGSL